MQERHWIESGDMEARPWAVEVLHTYSRRKPTNQDLEATVHIGQIEGKDPICIPIVFSFDNDAVCAEAVVKTLEERLSLLPEDIILIKESLEDIINH